MDSDQLLVWLERVPADGERSRTGAVCRRHADAMVVPRGWTLDDRRESRPRLFRVSDSSSTARAKRVPSRRPNESTVPPAEQLSLLDDTNGATLQDPLDDEVTVGEIRPLGVPDSDETQAIPWRFEFNERDDLGGLLNVDSPLLSRAFRGQQRAD